MISEFRMAHTKARRRKEENKNKEEKVSRVQVVSSVTLLSVFASLRELLCLILVVCFASSLTAADPRLGPWKTLNSGFRFTPPKTLEDWKTRSDAMRRQLLVALGMWPMPEKGPLDAKIFGSIDREGYTVEKVYFRSTPGHYVTGNLYRPKTSEKKSPAVLVAHGHWKDGRLHRATKDQQAVALKNGGEPDATRAEYMMQAHCAALAQMGFVAFIFDMVGSGESDSMPHASGFTDARAELYSHSAMGLQMWNCVRAFDFLSGLPEVDAKRVGVTGASGGGTQTFLLGAIDPRPAALFPAVMVSEAMQGGCVCENCSHLRVLGGNVEIAALAAPRPLGMTGADDWSREIETKGFPQLKELYKLYGKEDLVSAKSWPQYPHNFNTPAREMMENFFRKHLQGKTDRISEPNFKPIPVEQLHVFDADHPRPKDERDAAGLRKLWEARDAAILHELAEKPEQFREVIGTGWNVTAGGSPGPEGVGMSVVGPAVERDGVTVRKSIVTRLGEHNEIPILSVRGPEWDGTALVWVRPGGKAALFRDGAPTPELAAALKLKMSVTLLDPLGEGEKALPNAKPIDGKFAGYTYGYNRPIASEKVRDLLAVVSAVKGSPKTKRVLVYGQRESGPIALLAAAQSRAIVEAAYCDLDEFSFAIMTSIADPMLIPGALKFGGLGGAAALFAPNRLRLSTPKLESRDLAESLYAKHSKALTIDPKPLTADAALKWLANPPKE